VPGRRGQNLGPDASPVTDSLYLSAMLPSDFSIVFQPPMVVGQRPRATSPLPRSCGTSEFLAQSYQMSQFRLVYGSIFGLEFGPILDHDQSMRALKVAEDIVPVGEFKAKQPAGSGMSRKADSPWSSPKTANRRCPGLTE